MTQLNTEVGVQVEVYAMSSNLEWFYIQQWNRRRSERELYQSGSLERKVADKPKQSKKMRE